MNFTKAPTTKFRRLQVKKLMMQYTWVAIQLCRNNIFLSQYQSPLIPSQSTIPFSLQEISIVIKSTSTVIRLLSFYSCSIIHFIHLPFRSERYISLFTKCSKFHIVVHWFFIPSYCYLTFQISSTNLKAHNCNPHHNRVQWSVTNQ